MTIKLNEITRWLIRADEPFKGHAQSFIRADGTVAYTDGMTPDEYAAERGFPVKLITDAELDELIKAHEASLITAPTEVTKERFWDMLEVLPPCKWATHEGVEMFHVSERLTGDLVSWFAKLNGRYFEWTDQARAPAAERAAKVAAAAK